MKRSKFTDEQILAIVKEGEAGRKLADLCRTYGITEQTYYRWKAKYGGMELSEMQRLKQLEDENRRLKQIVAEQTLDIQALKAVVARNGAVVSSTCRWNGLPPFSSTALPSSKADTRSSANIATAFRAQPRIGRSRKHSRSWNQVRLARRYIRPALRRAAELCCPCSPLGMSFSSPTASMARRASCAIPFSSAWAFQRAIMTR